MPSLVSVIMPCRNAERMLRPALWSVFSQTYPNIELIFVDNNSTDGSADLASSMAAGTTLPVRFLECKEAGVNNARNLGYAHARGDYIQWLDADDALGLQKLEHQVRALEKDRSADFAYCDWMASRHATHGKREDRIVQLGPVEDHILRTLDGTWYPPHCYLIRRRAADKLQAELAWLPQTKVGTDVEYSAIAALLGMRFLHVPGARVQYNTWSPHQLSGANTKYAARAAALETIYRRLAKIARRKAIAQRVNTRHWTLLEQDWNIWTMPAGSVQIRRRLLGRYEIRHVSSGRILGAGQDEATVAATMLTLGHSCASAHYALLIAAKSPSLNNDIPRIVAAINRFRREGLLSGPVIPHDNLESTEAMGPAERATADLPIPSK
jgi:glycosyltransferase involved in cell wall biosynthesis